MDTILGLGKSLFGGSNAGDDDVSDTVSVRERVKPTDRDRESVRETLKDTELDKDLAADDKSLYSPSRILSLKNSKARNTSPFLDIL